MIDHHKFSPQDIDKMTSTNHNIALYSTTDKTQTGPSSPIRFDIRNQIKEDSEHLQPEFFHTPLTVQSNDIEPKLFNQDKLNKADGIIVECEPSFEEIEEISQYSIGFLKSDPKLPINDFEVKDNIIEKRPKLKKNHTCVTIQPIDDFYKFEQNLGFEDIFHTMPTMMNENVTNAKSRKTSDDEQTPKIAIKQNSRSANAFRESSRELQNNSSLGVAVQKPRKSSRDMQNNSIGIAVNQPFSDRSTKGFLIGSPREFQLQEDNKNSDLIEFPIKGNEHIGTDPNISTVKNGRKDTARLLDQSSTAKLFMKKVNDSSEINEPKKPNDLEPLYVERRYCTACNLDQPFRSKHCKQCNRCVAKYDHHCPWLGTCIGERNHMVFYWFIFFQATQLTLAELKLLELIIKESNELWPMFNTLLLITITFFFIMVNSLWLFHSYLATVNLTTWESWSWDHISYLREWRSEWGSPFSEGFFKNLKYFCCESKTQLRKWRLPKYKKKVHH